MELTLPLATARSTMYFSHRSVLYFALMDRRSFLSDLSRYALLCTAVPSDWRVIQRPRFSADPFGLGVAI